MGRILVVEDDQRTAELLGRLLQSAGFQAAAASSGEEALEVAASGGIDLVLLDVGLPGMDGFATCRALRALSDTPILMLTARGEPDDRVTGLEQGADDYVAKPFDPRELIARIRAILRRAAPSAGERVVEAGPVRLDPASRVVSLDGAPVELTTTEFDVLRVLVSRAGSVVPREKLMELARGSDYGAFNRSIDMHVSNLRRKLGDSSRSPKMIRTIRGIGYLFALSEASE